jgi:hypothetical protein
MTFKRNMLLKNISARLSDYLASHPKRWYPSSRWVLSVRLPMPLRMQEQLFKCTAHLFTKDMKNMWIQRMSFDKVNHFHCLTHFWHLYCCQWFSTYAAQHDKSNMCNESIILPWLCRNLFCTDTYMLWPPDFIFKYEIIQTVISWSLNQLSRTQLATEWRSYVFHVENGKHELIITQ